MLLLLLCVVPITFWSNVIRRNYQGPVKIADFSTIYFGTRCAIHRLDPYSRAAFFHELSMDGVSFANGSGVPRKEMVNFTGCVYLPPALFVTIPIAHLPWGVAQSLYTDLTAAFLVLAGFVVWDLGGEFAPAISGILACFTVANCMLLLLLGNPAGLVIGFCVVAAWCFLRGRHEWAGVLLLAISLVMKPHDAGFVWLFFLLAGGIGRKRALQALGVSLTLGVCSAVWIAQISPNWAQEVGVQVHAAAMRGGLNDPGPSGPSFKDIYPIVEIQDTISVFRNDPDFYDPVAYLIGGGLIMVWVVAVLRKRSTQEGALLALAAISILTLLPVYHRIYDTKLLLLTIPGCAVLWAGRGAKRWVAMGLTAAAIVVTSDIPVMVMFETTKELNVSPNTVSGKLTLLLLRPIPLVLLVAGCFYLWAYMGYRPAPGEREEQHSAAARKVEGVVT
jgi:hypothetical protein